MTQDRILADERTALVLAALEHGVDPLFLFAFRIVGAGRRGPSLRAEDFPARAAAYARLVRDTLIAFAGNPLATQTNAAGVPRLRYSLDFLKHFFEPYAVTLVGQVYNDLIAEAP